ncbi:MAG TPA: SLC13 family permease [Bacteroidales bacterium]|nr:SLC13 family permease [Bacteroidales bacterium]MDI9544370.1 SLC13 family permease [Bacteroidota bacterium]NLV39100.1 SLC13 family permease [Bacteroidales bacterium]HOQ57949.1 SLC13 family permease [Bacteroidales bacterium]HPB34832.1 SLC13 family permease [Bacteroidales bacterium]
MVLTLAILFVTAVFFVWGKIRSDIVALCSLLSLVLLGILKPGEALAGFSNSVVIMMVGLFIVGGAIFQTGLAKSISLRLLKFAGKSEIKLFLLVVLVTVFFGSFVSNTGTVALLLPIVVSMATEAGTNSRRLLMPMAYASSMGGMMTLIGTPPNMIINDTLIKAGYGSLSFFSFLPVGLMITAIGIVYLFPVSKILTRKKEKSSKTGSVKTPDQLSKEYQLADNLFRIEVSKNSDVINKKLSELNITENYHISILVVRRKDTQDGKFFKPVINQRNSRLVSADTTLLPDDLLYVFGNFEEVKKFVTDHKLSFLDKSVSETSRRPDFSRDIKFDEIGIAEVVVMSNSKLVNKMVKESGFRTNYNVNILGIKRSREYLIYNVKDEKIHSGDALLVQGTWQDIERLNNNEPDVVVVGQPSIEASKVPLTSKAPIAAIIMIAMVVAMVINIVPPVIAVMLAALAMILTGCFRNVEAAYKTINWESIVLFAAMIPMATAMEKTGASQMISGSIVGGLDSYGPYAVMAGIYLATSFLTMFISNTATAVLFAPIALQSALSMGVSPYPFLFAVTVAASMCFASPFSTPPNALVMSAGRYTFMDYVKMGLPLQIIYMIVMVFFIPLIFPF